MLFDLLTPVFFKDSVFWYMSLWIMSLLVGCFTVIVFYKITSFIFLRILLTLLTALEGALDVCYFIFEQVAFLPVRIVWNVYRSLYPKRSSVEKLLALLKKFSNDEKVIEIIDFCYSDKRYNLNSISDLVYILSKYEKTGEVDNFKLFPSQDRIISKKDCLSEPQGL